MHFFEIDYACDDKPLYSMPLTQHLGVVHTPLVVATSTKELKNNIREKQLKAFETIKQQRLDDENKQKRYS